MDAHAFSTATRIVVIVLCVVCSYLWFRLRRHSEIGGIAAVLMSLALALLSAANAIWVR